MLFTFFIALSLLGFGLFLAGFVFTRQWSLVLLGAVIILVTGMIVGTEGIQAPPVNVTNIGYDVSGKPITITEQYTTYNAATSFEAGVITNLYIYGAFVFLMLSLVAMLANAGVSGYELEAWEG